MCTAISIKGNNHYFGRNLDLEKRYGESIVITPRNYIFRYKSGEIERRHFAIIGTALVVENYPLYFDGTNEYGLSVAGLNFVGNAYHSAREDPNKINLAPYEILPYILGKCRSVDESEEFIKKINIVDKRFTDNLQNAQLHWMISDKSKSITWENTQDGSIIYPNPIGVLTNNPPFDYQMMNLNNYMGLSSAEPINKFSDKVKLENYSRGMGALGLPGDNSSVSRFVRCSFNKLNSRINGLENEEITQFFHILSSVEQIEGTVMVGNNYERTQYSSCCNTDTGEYFYKTYENSQINAIKMHNENLDSDKLISYKMGVSQQIRYAN